MSREQVAAALGCSLATVVRYETGRTTRITAARLVEIARATGKPVTFFFEAAPA